MEDSLINENNKKRKRNKPKNNKNKSIFHVFILFSILTIVFFLFLDYIFPKGLKSNKNQNNKEIQNINPDNLSLIQSLEANPHYHTEFILNLISNYNKIDFNNFEKNLKITVKKIYSIINNKKENEDAYVILSTIYGAFLADSMGSFCEFKSFNKNNHLEIYKKNNGHIFQPGQVTDDSEMAMSQAYAIMDNADINELNENLIYYYYLIWYNSHPLDIGITTRNALNMIKLDENNNIINL